MSNWWAVEFFSLFEFSLIKYILEGVLSSSSQQTLFKKNSLEKYSRIKLIFPLERWLRAIMEIEIGLFLSLKEASLSVDWAGLNEFCSHAPSASFHYWMGHK